MKQLLPLLHSALVIMTPLLFAATGGLYTELAGMLNIALEGLLLAGAFSALAATYFTGSVVVGFIAAVIASTLLSALLSGATLRLRSNVFITGLAANFLASGLTVVLAHKLFNTRGVIALRDIGSLPDALFIGGSWLLLLLSWAVLYKTPFGYRLRACDKHAEALSALGLKPDTYRRAAFLVSGFCCGIGGAFLSLNLGVFVPNMTAGKGWIALVVIFLGGRRPLGLIAAAFVFGLADAFSNYAQGLLRIPADFILAMPYVLTLIAMVVVSAAKRR